MQVGSSMSCYADGFPNPSISLFLRQPLRQYQAEPIIEPNQFYVTTSPSPPQELVIDNSPIALSSRIGLRHDEYTIRGGRFSLTHSASVGVELLLVCSAGNSLPNAADFLGQNKTITTARFIVAGESNAHSCTSLAPSADKRFLSAFYSLLLLFQLLLRASVL